MAAALTKQAVTKSRRKYVRVKITLLDGEKFDYDPEQKVKRHAIKVQDVIRAAHEKSGMNEESEFQIFSLYTYEICKEEQLEQKVFLDQRSASRKLIDHFYSKDERNSQVWEFHYGVKFYIPSCRIDKQLKSEQARWLYYLQLCKDLKEKKMFDADEMMENSIVLTSLMLRVKEADQINRNYPVLELIPKESQPEDYKERIHNAKLENGTAVSDIKSIRAVLEFILCVSSFPYHGKHLFLARTKQDVFDKGQLVIIATSCDGITVYCDKVQRAQLQITWNDMSKLSYKKNKFSIKCYGFKKSEIGNLDQPSKTRMFYTDEKYNKERPHAKWIWKNVLEQHAFFRLAQPEDLPLGTIMFTRKSSFRYNDTPIKKRGGKYIIEKECGTWKIVERPSSDVDLRKVETVETDMVDVVLSNSISENEFHFELKQDYSGIHCLVIIQGDQVTQNLMSV